MKELETIKIAEAIEEAGFEIRSYSGRGMYGKECLGVTCDDPQEVILETIAVFADNHDDTDELAELARSLKGSRTDSMGLQQILYWPSLIWVEELEYPIDGLDDRMIRAENGTMDQDEAEELGIDLGSTDEDDYASID